MAHCRTRLASYKNPKELHRVDAFPLNGTGKIAKKVLAVTLTESGDADRGSRADDAEEGRRA